MRADNPKKNKDGTYTIFWYLKRRPGEKFGRRKQKKFLLRKHALDFLAQQRISKERGDTYGHETKKIKISDLIDEYEYEVKKSDNAKDLGRRVLDRWRKWFSDNKIVYVSQIDKSLIKEYENKRAAEMVSERKGNLTIKRPVSKRTVEIDIRHIIAVLNHACRYDRIKHNPLSKYPIQKPDNRFRRYYDIDEISKMLDCSRTHGIFDLIYIYLTLGLRCEEAAFLQDTDIQDGCRIYFPPLPEKKGDPVKKIWFINKGIRFEKIWSPKWNKQRWVYFDENYANDEYLKEIFSRRKGYINPNPSHSDGRPLTKREIDRRFKLVLNDAGIKNSDGQGVHSLRHTHISYNVARVGLDKRINYPVIMENVGINDYETLNRYIKAVKNLSKNLPDPSRMPWQI